MERKMNALVGKYFVGALGGGTRSGIVEAAIDATHYIVRLDDLVLPVSLAVVPISEMAQGALVGPWAFFDDQEQRARYDEWEPSMDQTTPRAVPPEPSVN
jgi:hypothetical protein